MRWPEKATIVSTICALVCFLAPALASAAELVPLYTPPAGGTAYVLGAGVVSVTNKYVADASMVHEAATGTMEMVRRMIQRESQKKPCFAVFGSPDGFRAFKGEGEYGGKAFSTLRLSATRDL